MIPDNLIGFDERLLLTSRSVEGIDLKIVQCVGERTSCSPPYQVQRLTIQAAGFYQPSFWRVTGYP